MLLKPHPKSWMPESNAYSKTCTNCGRKLTDKSETCPYCGFDLLFFANDIGEDVDLLSEEKEIRRLRRQKRWLLLFIWIAVISFIFWIILRILSGVPDIRIPEFGIPEFF